MRKLIVSEFLSLDGVMEDPGGADRFEHGGWTMSYWDEAMGNSNTRSCFRPTPLCWVGSPTRVSRPPGRHSPMKRALPIG